MRRSLVRSVGRAIICVPSDVVQDVCDALVSAGIKGILSFVPKILVAPDDVLIRYIDVAANLAILASM